MCGKISCNTNKDVDNEPENFDGFVDFSVYGIFKGESMDHVALGNFDMKKEHAVYPHDQSKPYISISKEDKENLISTMGNPSHLTMTIGIFVNILLRTPSMLSLARGVSI